jgi:TatD DNase family protein
MLDYDPSTSLGTSWQEVGKQTIANGIWFVNVGADLKSSRLAVEQSNELGEGAFSCVGVHPIEKREEGDFAEITELARDPKVVAIGECGLEYYRIEDEEVKRQQKELFKKHIDLALELDKPVMIHCRATQNNTQKNDGSPLVTDAHEDVLEILKDYRRKVGDKLRFNMHFFTGTWAMAEKFIELGGYFSFNGVITFTTQYDEIVRNVPLDRIMSETDAPFVAPVPYRGKRNEPAYVEYVAKRICGLRPEPQGEVLTALVINAERFFQLSEVFKGDLPSAFDFSRKS